MAIDRSSMHFYLMSGDAKVVLCPIARQNEWI